MLRVSDSFDPLLNRPFSIAFINKEKKFINIIYRIVGKGTRCLSHINPGETLSLTPPLGRGFPLDISKGNPLVLLGGGMGIAPLLSVYMARNFSKEPTALWWGIKEKKEFFDLKAIHPKLGSKSLSVASEDGSTGTKGTVLDLFQRRINEIKKHRSILFACGPLGMLHPLHKICQESNLDLYVSMETQMACGTGFCLGCALPSSRGGYVKTCQDGPVFKDDALSWDKLNGSR